MKTLTEAKNKIVKKPLLFKGRWLQIKDGLKGALKVGYTKLEENEALKADAIDLISSMLSTGGPADAMYKKLKTKYSLLSRPKLTKEFLENERLGGLVLIAGATLPELEAIANMPDPEDVEDTVTVEETPETRDPIEVTEEELAADRDKYNKILSSLQKFSQKAKISETTERGLIIIGKLEILFQQVEQIATAGDYKKAAKNLTVVGKALQDALTQEIELVESSEAEFRSKFAEAGNIWKAAIQDVNNQIKKLAVELKKTNDPDLIEIANNKLNDFSEENRNSIEAALQVLERSNTRSRSQSKNDFSRTVGDFKKHLSSSNELAAIDSDGGITIRKTYKEALDSMERVLV